MRPHLLLGALALGIFAATLISLPTWASALPAVGAAAWLILRKRFDVPLLILLYLILGAALATRALPRPDDPTSLAGWADHGELLLQGRVEASSRQPDGRLALDLKTISRHDVSGSHRLRGGLRLVLEQAGEFNPGDRLQFLAALHRPQRFGNPGEFDWPIHLAAQEIEATAYLTSDRALARLPGSASASVADWISQLRKSLSNHLDRLLGPRRAALLRALLIGDKSAMPATDRDVLAQSGTAHLFSISGFHLGLVFLFLYSIAAWLYRRSLRLLLWQPPGRVLPLLLLPLLWCYVLLAGQGLPTQRAFLMAGMAAGLLLLERRCRPIHLLVGALLGLLLLQPLALFSPSLQLSAAGLTGILLLVPRWTSRIDRLPRLLRLPLQWLLVSLAAAAATFPIIWLHFHLVSLASPLANLLAVPIIGFIALPVGLTGLALQALPGPAADLLLQLSGWVCEQVLDLLAGMTALPGLHAVTSYPDLRQLSAAGLFLGALLLSANRPHRRKIRTGMVLVGGLLWALPWPRPAALQITAFSVGQGESLLVSRQGFQLLVDGGGLYGSSFDVGDRLIAPALGRMGVHRLDAVLLTHDHPDHWLGLVSILAKVPVGRFLSAMPREDLPPPLREVLDQQKIPSSTLPAGWSGLSDGSLYAFVPRQTASDHNDRSVAVYAGAGTEGALLTGDLTANGVQLLAAEPLPGPVTLLKLPHHGSRNSHPELFFQRFQPKFAFASAGRNNHFGFPHPEVVSELEARRIDFYRTDRDGLLCFTCRPSGWTVDSWANRLFR